MGCFASKSKKKTTELKPKPKKLVEFYYLDRKSMKIIHHDASGMFQTFRICKEANFYTDSAVGIISKTHIIMAGGSNKNRYSRMIYDVDLAASDFTALKKLPIASRWGYIIKHRNMVYFIGGITKSNKVKKSAPLMVLNLENLKWKFLVNGNGNQNNDLDPSFPIDNLWMPGAFLWNNKIYIVGGYKSKGNGKTEPNEDVYSLSLEDNSLRKEKFILSIEGVQPLCSVKDDEVTIISRYDPENRKPSFQCYLVKMIENAPMIKKLSPLCLELTEFYPAFHAENGTVYFSYPYFILKKYDLSSWQTFMFEEIIVARSLNQAKINRMENQMSYLESTGHTKIFSEWDDHRDSQWISCKWHPNKSMATLSISLVEIDCKEFNKFKKRKKQKQKIRQEINNLFKERAPEAKEDSSHSSSDSEESGSESGSGSESESGSGSGSGSGSEDESKLDWSAISLEI